MRSVNAENAGLRHRRIVEMPSFVHIKISEHVPHKHPRSTGWCVRIACHSLIRIYWAVKWSSVWACGRIPLAIPDRNPKGDPLAFSSVQPRNKREMSESSIVYPLKMAALDI